MLLTLSLFYSSINQICKEKKNKNELNQLDNLNLISFKIRKLLLKTLHSKEFPIPSKKEIKKKRKLPNFMTF